MITVTHQRQNILSKIKFYSSDIIKSHIFVLFFSLLWEDGGSAPDNPRAVRALPISADYPARGPENPGLGLYSAYPIGILTCHI